MRASCAWHGQEMIQAMGFKVTVIPHPCSTVPDPAFVCSAGCTLQLRHRRIWGDPKALLRYFRWDALKDDTAKAELLRKQLPKEAMNRERRSCVLRCLQGVCWPVGVLWKYRTVLVVGCFCTESCLSRAPCVGDQLHGFCHRQG